MSIPSKLREELNQDPFMSQCVLTRLGINHPCNGLEWHHVWIYARKQIQEKFAIIPVCQNAHKDETKYRNLFQWITLHRATKEELARYPKYDWLKNYELLHLLSLSDFDCFNRMPPKKRTQIVLEIKNITKGKPQIIK